MAVVTTFAAASPIVKVGRVAGQFAKPRSAPMERIGDIELPSYRGDIVNGIEFTPEAARIPDPQRQLDAYRQSAATLNLLRAFATGGYANLENAHRWMLSFVKPIQPAVRALPGACRSDLRDGRLHACDRARPGERITELRQTEFWTSHEALLLGFEQALTRVDSTTGDYYATSGHMIWIGDRTRQTRSRACRICAWREKSDRPEMRPVDQARRPATPDGSAPDPGERARSPDADLPLRRGERPANASADRFFAR